MKSKIVVLFVIASAVGCQSEPDVPSDGEQQEQESASAVPDIHSDPKAKALAAKDALFDELSTRLLGAMSNGGPAAAIEVCSKDAPRLAKEVGEAHGVKIGRTSFKLRNPKNTPPDWTAGMVDERVSEPRFVDLKDGTFGAFLPIKLKPQCMTCHGPEEQIDPAIKDALARLYPEDQATGFQVDELRGWFWVEVPAETDVSP